MPSTALPVSQMTTLPTPVSAVPCCRQATAAADADAGVPGRQSCFVVHIQPTLCAALHMPAAARPKAACWALLPRCWASAHRASTCREQLLSYPNQSSPTGVGEPQVSRHLPAPRQDRLLIPVLPLQRLPRRQWASRHRVRPADGGRGGCEGWVRASWNIGGSSQSGPLWAGLLWPSMAHEPASPPLPSTHTSFQWPTHLCRMWRWPTCTSSGSVTLWSHLCATRTLGQSAAIGASLRCRVRWFSSAVCRCKRAACWPCAWCQVDK